MRRQLAAVLLLTLLAPGARLTVASEETVLWPEQQRAFLEDGPGYLLSKEDREALLSATPEERQKIIDEFLASDPLADTPVNELKEAILRRLRIVHDEFLSLYDDRARVLFLNGRPQSRELIECGITFKPLEIWTYPGRVPSQIVFYQPSPDRSYRLWVPIDSKRPLYVKEMGYWLEQWEEYPGRASVKRFDLQTCPDTPLVDDATGIDGLRGFRKVRPKANDVLAYVSPPEDLAAWVKMAYEQPLETEVPELPPLSLQILFPDRIGQRLVVRFLVTVPPGTPVEPYTGGDEPTLILEIDGVIEQDDQIFDEFKARFTLDPPQEEVPIALSVERALRPDRSFVVHLRIHDEIGGGEVYLSQGFTVPSRPEFVEEPPLPKGTVIAVGEQLAKKKIAGADTLLLIPPGNDVILGLWRAEALVTGERIHKVVFLIDDKVQMTRTRRPFTAELRLSMYPTEQVVRAEGFDSQGGLVASDEVVLNQPRGSLRVRILSPERGESLSGTIVSRAEVIVPEDRRVESVEFRVNEQSLATLERPPWQAEIVVPAGGQVSYLTVVAILDDGSRAEEVRFLNAPQYLERVEVKLVELYTTVTEKSGRLAKGLVVEDFTIKEDDTPQEILKFELVEDLPITVGIVIDTSGSMVASLPEARRAAIGFLQSIITPRDRSFAVAFADRPVLLIPPTDDVGAVEESLSHLRSVGYTTLHDAVVTSLYYFRGIRGRRAMVLLSDGDDTASSLGYRETLEYARQSGVSIYSIGLNVGKLQTGVRRKLQNLAEESGGRVFFISRAEELVGVYREIEEELRSQYLVAYSPDRPATEGEFRFVEVKVKGGKLKARTIRGYYP